MSNDSTTSDIRTVTQKLIDRHGEHAVDIAKDRAKRLELTSDWPAHAVAVKVLAEVEKLAGEAR
jgi:hypothetical protein